jgi:catechol 2,3-dioxygenase-like lactoylglutathione lyase family enzyme
MTATFTQLRTVAVPVTDQDKSKALFEDLGFATTFDAELQPGFRWLELAAPGGGATLSLVTTGDQLPTGIDTGIRLVTPDARSAHASLVDRGLEVGDLLDWPSTPLMFSFVDPDGNRFYVSEG